MRHGHVHKHSHLHMLKRQKVICPWHEDCRHNDHNHPCAHGVPHIENSRCRESNQLNMGDLIGSPKCPSCIMTQEVIEEETFTEEEFKL